MAIYMYPLLRNQIMKLCDEVTLYTQETKFRQQLLLYKSMITFRQFAVSSYIDRTFCILL